MPCEHLLDRWQRVPQSAAPNSFHNEMEALPLLMGEPARQTRAGGLDQLLFAAADPGHPATPRVSDPLSRRIYAFGTSQPLTGAIRSSPVKSSQSIPSARAMDLRRGVAISGTGYCIEHSARAEPVGPGASRLTVLPPRATTRSASRARPSSVTRQRGGHAPAQGFDCGARAMSCTNVGSRAMGSGSVGKTSEAAILQGIACALPGLGIEFSRACR